LSERSDKISLSFLSENGVYAYIARFVQLFYTKNSIISSIAVVCVVWYNINIDSTDLCWITQIKSVKSL